MPNLHSKANKLRGKDELDFWLLKYTFNSELEAVEDSI